MLDSLLFAEFLTMSIASNLVFSFDKDTCHVGDKLCQERMDLDSKVGRNCERDREFRHINDSVL